MKQLPDFYPVRPVGRTSAALPRKIVATAFLDLLKPVYGAIGGLL